MHISKKLLLALASLTLMTMSVLAVLELSGTTNLIRDKNNGVATNANTTSTEPSAQTNFQDGEPNKQAGNTISENEGSANISDTNGTGFVDNSNPITSKTGQISVYSPVLNQLVKPGDVLAGTSSLHTISYRIIDNVSGMISNGELNVNEGKFSGTLAFSTSATEGRIDLFATNPDGSEYSNVEIVVRFK